MVAPTIHSPFHDRRILLNWRLPSGANPSDGQEKHCLATPPPWDYTHDISVRPPLPIHLQNHALQCTTMLFTLNTLPYTINDIYVIKPCTILADTTCTTILPFTTMHYLAPPPRWVQKNCSPSPRWNQKFVPGVLGLWGDSALPLADSPPRKWRCALIALSRTTCLVCISVCPPPRDYMRGTYVFHLF